VNREYLDGFVATTSRRELKPVVETLFADKSLVTRQLLENLLKYKRIDGVGKTLRTLAQDLTSGSSAPALPSTLPVLVIRGKEDRVIPGVGSDALGSNARSEVIAGAGHMVQMEAAREVNALLREHLGAAAQAE
jgi:pyruvate dehydrogenase E2 component (dihydrolipoamide acetyltransferase)